MLQHQMIMHYVRAPDPDEIVWELSCVITLLKETQGLQGCLAALCNSNAS